MVFPWSLSDSKSLQVSSTLLCILADDNNVVVLMVFTHPLISKSSSPSTIILVTLSNAPVTIGISFSFAFYSFFSVLEQSLGTYLPFHFPSVLSCCQPQRQRQSTLFGRFFLFCRLSLGMVVKPTFDELFVSQNPKEFCASLFLGQVLYSAYIIRSYGQILTSWEISRGSPSPLVLRLSHSSFTLWTFFDWQELS